MRFTSLLSAAALLLVVASAKAQSPFHVWRLDENPITNGTTTVHDSVGTNDGTFYGDTAPATGFYQGAVHFDGTGDGAILTGPSTAIISSMSTFTITSFFKVDAGYATGDRFIYGESNASDTGLFRPALLLRISSGQVQFGTFNGGFNFATAPLVTLTPGTWYLAAGVHDATGNRVDLYDATTRTLLGTNFSAGFSNATTTNNSTIGAWTGAGIYAGPQNSWLGTLDEVRLYNTALTQTQTAAVPEPAGLALVLGGASLLWRRRRAS